MMDMSYTKAWRLLRETEDRLGWALVERHVGGPSGGGTSLTPRGRDLLVRFERLTHEVDAAMRDSFARLFGDWAAHHSTEEEW